MGWNKPDKLREVAYDEPMATPAPVLCIEKERLIRAFAHAALEYNRLTSIRVAALLKGDQPPPQGAIADAETRKENAKYAVLAHQDEHGC